MPRPFPSCLLACPIAPNARVPRQDLFWWFYCDKFGKGDQAAEQERMFGRMATNFVGLLTKVHARP